MMYIENKFNLNDLVMGKTFSGTLFYGKIIGIFFDIKMRFEYTIKKPNGTIEIAEEHTLKKYNQAEYMKDKKVKSHWVKEQEKKWE